MNSHVRDQLAALATHLENGTMSHHSVAASLRVYAARNLVELPLIHPERDDLTHWVDLPDDRLRNENDADAWSLSAGLFEQRRRVAERERLLREAMQLAGVPDEPR